MNRARGTLTQKDVDDFCRNGFLIVSNVFSVETVQALRKAVAEIRDTRAVRRKRNVYGIRHLLELSPAVVALAKSAEIKKLVEPILGSRVFAVRATFFDKVAGANWSVGWHQDRVIAVSDRRQVPGFQAWSKKAGVWQVQPPAQILAGMVAIRVHLDDCDVDNGPLRVIQETHLQGWIGDLEEWKQNGKEIVCTVKAGGVHLLRPLLLHASKASKTAEHRRVIHLEYAACDLPGGLRWQSRVELS